MDTTDFAETIEFLLADIHDLRAQNESSRALMGGYKTMLRSCVHSNFLVH